MVKFYLTDALQYPSIQSTPIAINNDGSLVAYFYSNYVTSPSQSFIEVQIFAVQQFKLVPIAQIETNNFFQYSQKNFPGVIAAATASCDLSNIVIQEFAVNVSGTYEMRLRYFKYSKSGLVELQSYTVEGAYPLSYGLSNIIKNKFCVLYQDVTLANGHVTSFYLGSNGLDLQVDKLFPQIGTNLIFTSNRLTLVKHFNKYYIIFIYSWGNTITTVDVATNAYLGVAEYSSQKLLTNANLPLEGTGLIVFRSCDDFLKIIVATPHPIQGPTFPYIYTTESATAATTLINTPNQLDNVRVYCFDGCKLLLVNSYEVKGGIKGFSQNGLSYNTFLASFSEQSPYSTVLEANGTTLIPLRFHDATNEICLTCDLNSLIGTSALAYTPLFSGNGRWLAVSGSAYNFDNNNNLINNNVQLYIIKC